MKPGRFKRAWRSPYWLRPIAVVAGFLIGVSMFLATYTNLGYRRDRQQAFEQQQDEVVALRDELQCVRRESSEATRLEGEIGREGWLAMTIWARTGDSAHPRIVQAAERTDALYRVLGPALERRAEAAERCD